MARRRRATLEQTERTCKGPCGETKPQDREHFAVKGTGKHGQPYWDAWCKPCRAAQQREKYRNDPKYREAHLRAAERQRERIATDPEYRVGYLEKQAAWQREWRRQNAERSREREREYRARLMKDPERRRVKRENQRMAYRLRQERAGVSLETIRNHEGVRERDEAATRMRMLPTRELAVAVERKIAALIAEHGRDDRHEAGYWTREAIAERWGTSGRTLYAWAHGERATVTFNIAERLMIEADLMPWDVFTDPDVLTLWDAADVAASV